MKQQQVAICLNNRGYEASLEVGKLYRVIANEQAATHDYICVIDESDEDYAYSAERFFCLKLPW
ncbi:MAG TPA: hypothetical protein VF177_08110 [Anaerolineae bacterium]